MEEVQAFELARYLHSQREIARLLIAGDSLEDVAPDFISAVIDLVGWEAGALWRVDAEAGRLGFVCGASVPGVDAEPLWQLSRTLAFEQGDGLPGRAWASGEIVWMPRLRDEPGFVRAEMAEALGIEAAFAIPVPLGPTENVLAVAELHTRTFDEQSPELLAVLSNCADQLATFMVRHRAETQLEAGEKFKASILAASLDAIVGMDSEGTIIEFNKAAEQLFGYRRAEAIGRELASLIIPEHLRDRHRTALDRYLETGKPTLLDRRTELPAVRKDGSLVEVELTVTRIESSEPPLFTGFIRDMSDRAEAERARQHLAEVVNSTQDAVLSKDLEGVLTSWNRGAERIYGYSAREAIGRHISFLIPSDHANEEQMIIDRIKQGERIETYETERIRADGTRIDVALTVSPITTSRGLVGASVVARDITAEKRRRRAQDFLVAVTRLLESSLDPTATARTIVATAVPELAELCLIDLMRDDGRLGDSVVAAIDPQVAAALEKVRRNAPLDPAGHHPVAQALRERRPMIWKDLQDPDVVNQVAQDDEHRRLIASAGYSSAAVVPMIPRGRVLGAISFLHTRSDRRYDAEELEFLAELGDRAAMALDNAGLYYERDRTARSLQRGLRPPRPPSVAGLEIGVVFEAAGEGIDIGGDVYDVLPTDDGCWILIADVAGKGSDAAAVSVALRHSVRGLTRVIDDPAEVLGRVNELLLIGETLNDVATALLMRMRRVGDRWDVSLAAAGHPPAIHLTDAGPAQLGGGVVLGAWSEPPAESHEFRLSPGETLALCTDGWLEVGAASSHVGVERLAAKLTELDELETHDLAKALRHDAIARGRGRLRDDLVVLVLRGEAAS